VIPLSDSAAVVLLDPFDSPPSLLLLLLVASLDVEELVPGGIVVIDPLPLLVLGSGMPVVVVPSSVPPSPAPTCALNVHAAASTNTPSPPRTRSVYQIE
jgi:hypothetical protein